MAQTTAVQRLPALIEAASAVVGAGDLQGVLRQLVSEARVATGARYAALGVIGEHGVLVQFIHEGMTPEEVEAIGSLPRGLGVLGTVVRDRETIVLDSIGDHPDSYGFPPHHPPMTTFLGVPVIAGGEAFGNLYLTDKEGGFTDDDVVLAEALSRIAGSAVVTARLHDRLQSIALVEDRERIARDLHDSVIQDLFAVGLSLQSISGRVADSSVATTLDSSVDRLDRVVEELRSYIFQLRAARGRAQLDERLREAMTRLGSAYPTPIAVEIGVTSLEDERLEDEVLKIVNEAVSNSLRHSAASQIDVVVDADDLNCRIEVRDDGMGFEVDQAKSGMGLGNLTSRAARLGGKATIVSRSGEGTTVEVLLPLKR